MFGTNYIETGKRRSTSVWSIPHPPLPSLPPRCGPMRLTDGLEALGSGLWGRGCIRITKGQAVLKGFVLRNLLLVEQYIFLADLWTSDQCIK